MADLEVMGADWQLRPAVTAKALPVELGAVAGPSVHGCSGIEQRDPAEHDVSARDVGLIHQEGHSAGGKVRLDGDERGRVVAAPDLHVVDVNGDGDRLVDA